MTKQMVAFQDFAKAPQWGIPAYRDCRLVLDVWFCHLLWIPKYKSLRKKTCVTNILTGERPEKYLA
jgi:hypothetical protein